jgi:hypothetical protein
MGKDNRISEAMDVLKKAMVADNPQAAGSYAHSWHCNIAMACYDAIRASESVVDDGLQHEDAHRIGNNAASRFMKLCFGVDTKA